MKFLSRVLGFFLALLCLPTAQAQFLPASASLKVAKIEIKHVGPAQVSDDLIRANIRIKTGDVYRAMAVDDDIRNLYATGLFYNIRVTDETTAAGVVLTYLLQAKPKLTEIRFAGNTKFSDNKLKKKVTSKVGEPLDERKLFTDCQSIQDMYQKKGYPGTQVKYVPNIDETAGRGSVTFQVTESPKIRIEDVEFVGANAFTERKLRSVLKTRRHWWLSWLTGSGVFKDEQFEDDRERLTEFYRSQGYIDFEIKDIRFEHPTPNSMIIVFNISEGQQYKVGAVKFVGNKVFSTNEIAAGLRAMQPHNVLAKNVKLGPNGLKMDVGDTFTPVGLETDQKQVADFYGARGYIDVGSSRTLRVNRVPNTETGTMDLEFNIEEGQKSYVEKIDIRGNTKTKDRVIRRELAIAPGEVYDMVRIRISKERLEGLQYFEKVDTRPEPTDIANHKNLVVGVEEKNTGNMTVGAAFSSVDALVGYVEVTQGNFDLFHPSTFTGGGQKLRLRAQLGTQRKDYELEFIEPWFLQRKLALDTSLFYHDLDFVSPENLYREIRAGGRVSLTRALGSDFVIGSAGYSLENVAILFNDQVNGNFYGGPQSFPGMPVYVPQALLDQAGYTLVSKIFGSLAYDTRNAVLLPDKGQRTELITELAGPFGGVLDYYKIDMKTRWYFKGPFNGHVLELVGGIGVADSYGSSDQVPFWDRYYLGGMYSLRAYRYHNVSPRQPDNPETGFHSNEPIGGDSYWFGSAEYSLPIIERLRFALFYDVGTVNLDSYDWSAEGYSSDWGVGVRLNLPIGPLRLDYAFPIKHDQYNGSSGRFQFGVGYSRPF
ncbi:MAG: outer membrane protein assembly factor BamA [Verrucomicrobiota bacterium]